jgi:hypothetical protein
VTFKHRVKRRNIELLTAVVVKEFWSLLANGQVDHVLELLILEFKLALVGEKLSDMFTKFARFDCGEMFPITGKVVAEE